MSGAAPATFIMAIGSGASKLPSRRPFTVASASAAITSELSARSSMASAWKAPEAPSARRSVSALKAASGNDRAQNGTVNGCETARLKTLADQARKNKPMPQATQASTVGAPSCNAPSPIPAGGAMVMKVVGSRRSGHNPLTLLALTALTVFLFLVMGFAEWVRSRLLVRASAAFDARLSNRVFRASFEARLRNSTQSGGRLPQQALADLTTPMRLVARHMAAGIVHLLKPIHVNHHQDGGQGSGARDQVGGSLEEIPPVIRTRQRVGG